MCAGAIIQARVERVVYAVADPKFGGVESLFKILSDKRVNHRPEVVKIELEEAVELLRSFFKLLRP
jgi:tRNA(adenine34) deaminase